MADDVGLDINDVTNADAVAAVVLRTADDGAVVAAVGVTAAATHTKTGGLRSLWASRRRGRSLLRRWGDRGCDE